MADLYINLGATFEDHAEVRFIMWPVTGTHSLVWQTGNEKDVTMQAGRQRGALPLIRKFNDHSERLLNSALWVYPSYNMLSPLILLMEGETIRHRSDGGLMVMTRWLFPVLYDLSDATFLNVIDGLLSNRARRPP